ncbi:MAG: phosphoribosylamine--glycine ligase [Planctomycetota bacterium]
MAEKMKILVIGSGGREHALCWKIAQSPLVGEIHCAPGNPGIERLAKCHTDCSLDDIDSLVKVATRVNPDLAVIGPEGPLCAGLVERFGLERIKCFGPSVRAAELEGSKAFAKSLMRRHGIPTADFVVFDQEVKAIAYIEEHGAPLVVKASGLAAGKGAIVARSMDEAKKAVRDCFSGKFGAAGREVVIEEFMRGEEASVLALVDGGNIAVLPAAQDHKAAFDGDQGPNTGGMGAYSPAPVVTHEMEDRIIREVLWPTVMALKKENREFKGVLYAGLMITPQGPRVVEFNVRFGDPECQAVLLRLKSDLVPLMLACIDGTLDQQDLQVRTEAACCVILAAGGYPGSYPKGDLITGLDPAPAGVQVFHAGTAWRDARTKDAVVTNGGRVLGVAALGDSIEQAVEKCYAGMAGIAFDGMQFRRDIGHRALKRGAR